MKAYKCDRCGEYFDNMNHVDISEVVEDTDKKSSTAFYQLCPSCESTLLSWLHNEKGEETHTTYADDQPLYSCSKEVAAELGTESTTNASEKSLMFSDKEVADGLNYFLNEYDNYKEHTIEKDNCGVVSIRCTRPKESARYSMQEYNLTDLAKWFERKTKED